MGSCQIDPAGQQAGIHDPFKQGHGRFPDLFCRCCRPLQIGSSVGRFGDPDAPASILDRSLIRTAVFGKVALIITHMQDDLICQTVLSYKVQGQGFRHFLNYDSRLFKSVWPHQDLAGSDAAGFRNKALDFPHGAGLPAPGMVDQQLRVDPEQLIEQVLIMVIAGLSDGTPGYISHGIESVLLQLLLIAPAHSPEVCQGPVGPEQAAVGHLIELGDPYPVPVCRNMFGDNIHGHLCQVHIGADSGCGSDTRLRQDITDNTAGQLMGTDGICIQVIRNIHEHFINGVDMDIFRSNILQIDLIDPGRILHIAGHLRYRADISELLFRIGPELSFI